MSAQARESINTLKDLAVANYVKTLDTIPTSVHVFASSRSAHPTEVDGSFIVAGDGSTNLFTFVQITNTGIEYMSWELEPKSQVQVQIKQQSVKGFHQVQIVVDIKGLTKDSKEYSSPPEVARTVIVPFPTRLWNGY